LPTYTHDYDNSIAGRDLYIRTDAIFDIKHNTVFRLVNDDHISIVGTLFSIIIHAVIALVAIDLYTLRFHFHKTFFEYQVIFEVLFEVLREFFFQKSLQQVFGALIVIESNGSIIIIIIICKPINALVVLILYFIWR
jgi:hypothetical protein